MVILSTVIITLVVTIIYFNLKSPGKRIEHKIVSKGSLDSPTVIRSIGQLLGPPLIGGNTISSLKNGAEIFPSMLSAIASAKCSITFETFIYWSGTIGKQFTEALIERAQAGIKVHVLLDWIGSNQFDQTSLNKMISAGVEVERYRPLHWYTLTRFNNRTHRKILVVDGLIGFTGGVGIADHWQGNAENPEHWRDQHFKIEGPVVAQLQAAFMDNWNKTRPEVLDGDSYFPEIPICGNEFAQVFKSSPEEGSGSVRFMYLYSVAHAKKSIKIANAYFVPDSHLRLLLIAASARGVKVQIIVPGKNIDTKITRYASRAVWDELISAGIEIYEYQPTMLHCKYLVIDDVWSSVGSTNLDNRSFRLNAECNLNVVNKTLALKLAEIFEEDRSCSLHITLKAWRKRQVHQRVLEWVAFRFRSQV